MFLQKQSLEQKLDSLKSDYPDVYIEYCLKYELFDEYEQYVKGSVQLKNSPGKYAQFIHGCLIPSLKKETIAGKTDIRILTELSCSHGGHGEGGLYDRPL